jgi:putative membrane protein
MKKENGFSLWKFLFKIFQGAFVGLGAVLPGVSGGVLCVIFGIYKTIMEFLADPFRKLKTHVPKLLPYGIGIIVGFLGIAKLLAFLLGAYEAQSVCVFIGLIAGMVPSLFREAGEK